MLIFIENTPRSYAWGSTDALPEMLGTKPTGKPQAELWFGTHPGSPAKVAKATPAPHSVIDLVEADPDRYGVDGGPLPFLLKVLAIAAPLSLQAHPDRAQAAAGFAAEEAAGVARDARDRNYGDPNHKPELLVALSEVSALCGFRSLAHARDDLDRYAQAAARRGEAAGADALNFAGQLLCDPDRPDAEVRRAFIAWTFSGDAEVTAALAALVRLAALVQPEAHETPWSVRDLAMRSLITTHAADPGVLVALLLNHVRLAPGEAIYLGARQLHAYLGGVAVEVMAASDNVLRAGLTEKHVDIGELTRVVDFGQLDDLRIEPVRLAQGLVAWRPEIDDFQLLRARLCEPESRDVAAQPGSAERVTIDVAGPAVLVVTDGRVRVERLVGAGGGLEEVVSVKRGQALYVTAGEPIEVTGHGELFLATVGEHASCGAAAGTAASSSADARNSKLPASEARVS